MLRDTTIGNPVVIDMKNVGIRYDMGPEILSDINLSLRKASFHFLTGKSGAGKTSLLSMMYLAQKPSRGVLNVFGKNVNFTNRDALALLLQAERDCKSGLPAEVILNRTLTSLTAAGRKFMNARPF